MLYIHLCAGAEPSLSHTLVGMGQEKDQAYVLAVCMLLLDLQVIHERFLCEVFIFLQNFSPLNVILVYTVQWNL